MPSDDWSVGWLTGWGCACKDVYEFLQVEMPRLGVSDGDRKKIAALLRENFMVNGPAPPPKPPESGNGA